MLRSGEQDLIQRKLDHLDQMDIVTMSMADIGAEMGSIQDEISMLRTLSFSSRRLCRVGGSRLRVGDH